MEIVPWMKRKITDSPHLLNRHLPKSYLLKWLADRLLGKPWQSEHTPGFPEVLLKWQWKHKKDINPKSGGPILRKRWNKQEVGSRAVIASLYTNTSSASSRRVVDLCSVGSTTHWPTLQKDNTCSPCCTQAWLY